MSLGKILDICVVASSMNLVVKTILLYWDSCGIGYSGLINALISAGKIWHSDELLPFINGVVRVEPLRANLFCRYKKRVSPFLLEN